MKEFVSCCEDVVPNKSLSLDGSVSTADLANIQRPLWSNVRPRVVCKRYRIVHAEAQNIVYGLLMVMFGIGSNADDHSKQLLEITRMRRS